MRFWLVALVAIVTLAAPRPAFAGKGWWDFLEALSGPGPFKGMNHYMFEGWCGQRAQVAADGGQPARALNWIGRPSPGDAKRTAADIGRQPCVYFELSDLEAPPRVPYKFAVHARVVDVGVSYELIRPLELGAGIGYIRFSAPGERGTLTPSRAVASPLRLVIKPLFMIPALQKYEWPDLVRVYFKQSIIIGELSGSDFGVADAVFSEPSEFVRSWGVIVDAGQVIRILGGIGR